MAITQSVTTIFKSKDETSAKFNKMGKNAKKFGETSSRAFKKASRSATSFGTITKGILAAGAIQKAAGLATRGIGAATRGFLDFDQAITSASAKFSDLNLNTKEGQKTLLELKKTARAVGATTEFAADQAASGLDFLALAGFKSAQAMALLPGVVNLATVANVELGEATDIASDSLGAFGLMTKNTEQLTKNFTRVQDVMAKTTATSNTNLIDLFESIKKGAPAFTAAGQSMESFNALAGEMANSGVKGSESGTQLRNVMLRLAKPTKESGDLLNKLGVRTQDASGNFRDVIDILVDFEKGLKGMGTAQKSAALKTVFGARSVTGISILLKSGTQRLRSYRQMLIDSAGASKKMADIMRSSLINRLKSLGSAALEVGFQFFDAFDEQGAGAIDKLTKFVRRIDLTPLINGIKFVSNTVSDLFSRVMRFGESSGIFAKVSEAIDALNPVFTTVIDNFSSLFDFLKDAGVFEIVGDAISILADTVTILARVFVKFWDIVRPILTKFGELIKPIISSLGSVIKFIGGGVSAFKDLLAPETAAGESERQPFPARTPPNQTEIESRRQSNFVGRLDIAGAPEGSTFKSTSTGPEQIDAKMFGVPQF